MYLLYPSLCALSFAVCPCLFHAGVVLNTSSVLSRFREAPARGRQSKRNQRQHLFYEQGRGLWRPYELRIKGVSQLASQLATSLALPLCVAAKNIILAGPRAVGLHDTKPAQGRDLGGCLVVSVHAFVASLFGVSTATESLSSVGCRQRPFSFT